ncbi:hypothetical protein [Polaribacter sp.]|uniref:hypothetical protein n=1 Tax=Polaribacter sp. TaxID=1920175 RepID=UPI003EF67C96
MISEKQYEEANIELEELIKRFDAGENVDDRLNLVSDIIEAYEEINYPMDIPSSI